MNKIIIIVVLFFNIIFVSCITSSSNLNIRNQTTATKSYNEKSSIQTFQNIQPPYLKTKSGNPIRLINNPNSINPTWERLKIFLKQDQTESEYYDINEYPCGAFAETLHNNAEANGIKCGWVAIIFLGESIGHAINVFNTTDLGLVYIDCMNTTNNISNEEIYDLKNKQDNFQDSSNNSIQNYDTVAYVEIGRLLGFINVNIVDYQVAYYTYLKYQCSPKHHERPPILHPISYDYYLKYRDNANEFKIKVNSFNAKVIKYNNEVKAYNNYARLTRAQLNSDREYLMSFADILKTEYTMIGDIWEPMGFVKNIEIYW